MESSTLLKGLVENSHLQSEIKSSSPYLTSWREVNKTGILFLQEQAKDFCQWALPPASLHYFWSSVLGQWSKLFPPLLSQSDGILHCVGAWRLSISSYREGGTVSRSANPLILLFQCGSRSLGI